MDKAELARNTILEVVQKSGTDGVLESQIVSELVCIHKIDYYEALALVQNNYKAAGVEQNKGAVVRYYMPVEEKKESLAVRLAKKLAKNNVGELESRRILNYYRVGKRR